MPPEFQAHGMIGRTAAMARVLRDAARVAPLDVPVLVTGDSATGKRLLATAIHENSPRRGAKLVEVNCAALPEVTAVSEVFGQLPGYHRQSVTGVVGAIVGAEHGTLLLSEIGELSRPAQRRLLGLLQSGTYYPVGSIAPVAADVRVIATSSDDLQAAVAECRFHGHLYDRLQEDAIPVPSLDERREDVAELADFFCARTAEQHGVPHLRLSPEAHRRLEEWLHWPGNVRQLEHCIEFALLRAAGEGSASVEASHVFPPAPRTVDRSRPEIARSRLYNLIQRIRKRPEV